MKNVIDKLFASQLDVWELAGKNFEALRDVKLKNIKMPDVEEVVLQFNPARIISSSAKVDSKSLAERPCFLCEKNRPKEQEGVVLAEDFLLLVNPFPILQKHFTIVNVAHTPQRILPYISQMLTISQQLGKEYTLFYNGAKCGASAPDHMHFQAGCSVQFPIWKILEEKNLETLLEKEGVSVKAFESYVKGIVIEGKDCGNVEKFMKQILAVFATLQPQEDEPMLNILAKYEDAWQIILFPRAKHRPKQYFAEGDEQLLLSPASVDFGGLLAVPRKADFDRIDALLLTDIFNQLCLSKADFRQLKEKIKAL